MRGEEDKIGDKRKTTLGEPAILEGTRFNFSALETGALSQEHFLVISVLCTVVSCILILARRLCTLEARPFLRISVSPLVAKPTEQAGRTALSADNVSHGWVLFMSTPESLKQSTDDQPM